MNTQLDEEDTVLRVGSASSVGSVAGAIAHCVYAGKHVTLRVIGAGAVNQAMKSLVIASAFVASKNLTLDVHPAFVTVDTEDSGRTSAMLLRVLVHELLETS